MDPLKGNSKLDIPCIETKPDQASLVVLIDKVAIWAAIHGYLQGCTGMEAVKEFLIELESADSLVSSWSDIPWPKETTTLCDVLDGLIQGANSSGNTKDESGMQYGHGIIESRTYWPWIKNWANIKDINLAKVISLAKQQALGQLVLLEVHLCQACKDMAAAWQDHLKICKQYKAKISKAQVSKAPCAFQMIEGQ